MECPNKSLKVWHPGSTYGSVTFEMDSPDVTGLSDLCFPESHSVLLTHQGWGPAGRSPWRSSCSPLSSWFSSFVIHCWDTAAKGISGGDPDELHCVFVTLEFPVKFIQGNNMSSGEDSISVTAMTVLQMQWKANTYTGCVMKGHLNFWCILAQTLCTSECFYTDTSRQGIILYCLCYLCGWPIMIHGIGDANNANWLAIAFHVGPGFWCTLSYCPHLEAEQKNLLPAHT